jgi:hypothetical protein
MIVPFILDYGWHGGCLQELYKSIFQFIVNLTGYMRRSDSLKDPSKILSQQSVFTIFSLSINRGGTAECYGDSEKALEFKRSGFILL